MYVFDVGSDHNVRAAGSVALKMRFQGIACTFLDEDTLVAFSQETSVSLQRLESMRLETVYQIGLNDTRRLLFFGDLLIVADKTGAIMSVRASDKTLTEKRVLLDAQASVSECAWTLAGDRLVLSDSNLNTRMHLHEQLATERHRGSKRHFMKICREGSNTS